MVGAGNRSVARALLGPGQSMGSDTSPALLSPGEFVVNKRSAQKFGYGKLRKINQYADGGGVGDLPQEPGAVSSFLKDKDLEQVLDQLENLKKGLKAGSDEFETFNKCVDNLKNN